MTNIVLVNLLIAIMGDTYQREKLASDKKWVRERYVKVTLITCTDAMW